MASRDYHLITCWVIDGRLDDVALVLHDPGGFARWFPAVVRDVRVLDPGGPDGIGVTAVTTVKGWMPHTLTFFYRVADRQPPRGVMLDVWGDFEGRLDCRAVEVDDHVMIYFDWKVRVNKRFVRYLSWLLRPLFVSNHLWVVARGQESLDLELRRRREEGDSDSILPAPPGPTFPHGGLDAYVKSRVWSLAKRLSSVPEVVSR